MSAVDPVRRKFSDGWITMPMEIVVGSGIRT